VRRNSHLPQAYLPRRRRISLQALPCRRPQGRGNGNRQKNRTFQKYWLYFVFIKQKAKRFGVLPLFCESAPLSARDFCSFLVKFELGKAQEVLAYSRTDQAIKRHVFCLFLQLFLSKRKSWQAVESRRLSKKAKRGSVLLFYLYLSSL